MRAAAEKGHVRAQNNYGAYCLQGFGVKPDPTEAVAWLHRAADKGDPLAMFSLGMCYEQGLGTTPNIAAAVNWYRKSALNKQAEAAAALERIYLNDAGAIKKNEAEAFAWAKLGSELGDAGCLNDCGFMYEHGQGTKPNLEKAGACYLAAAEKGFAHAYSNLGRLYLDASKLKLDPVTAYKWFLVGVANGDGFSRHYLQEMDLKQMLTNAQKAAAAAAAQSYENKQRSPKVAG
jgi:TPR repeat protein